MPISTADSLGGRIIGVSGDTYAGAVLPLGDGESVIIGRDPQNSSIILSDPKISRVHCRITYRAAQRAYQVKDFSTNGTFVYGDENWRLPQKKDIMLTPGTVLQIGDSDFRFRLG